jgi:hypothetical protein
LEEERILFWFGHADASWNLQCFLCGESEKKVAATLAPARKVFPATRDKSRFCLCSSGRLRRVTLGCPS